VTPGTDPGAPSIHRITGKLIWATGIATVLFAILGAVYAAGLIPVDVIAAINGPHR
jgi:predicted secreted protein